MKKEDKFNSSKLSQFNILNAIFKIFFRENKADSELILSDCHDILVINFDLIGDAVMMIPFLKVLRKSVPDAHISVVGQGFLKDMYDGQGLVDEIIICKSRFMRSLKTMYSDYKNAMKVIHKVNRKYYDLVLEPRGDLRDILFMHLCRADRKVGYNYTGGEYMMTDVIKPSESIEHLIDDKLYFLKMLGCNISDDDRYPKLIITSEQKGFIDEYKKQNNLENKFVIGIHPGASMEIKMWPKFDELLKLLYKKYPEAVFAIFEEPGSNKGADKLINLVDDIGAEYIFIKEKFKKYLSLIAICDIVICNDSGIGHIATAYGIETHVIFGPVLENLAKPLSTENVYTYSENIDCKPCLRTSCDRHIECLQRVSVADVYNNIVSIDRQKF